LLATALNLAERAALSGVTGAPLLQPSAH
jgi:hypothetical protein